MWTREVMRQDISIHAPLTGSDCDEQMQIGSALYFNPRSPYGERQPAKAASLGGGNFNPRSPYGERPAVLGRSGGGTKFQSTLPLRGATC